MAVRPAPGQSGNYERGRSLGAFSFLWCPVAVTAKAAILIDGGYFLKRLPHVRRDVDTSNAEDVARAIRQLVSSHLDQLNQVHTTPNPLKLLYRCFYYDAWPYAHKGHEPISKRAIDYAKSEAAIFRRELFDALRRRPNLALRLGQVTKPGDRSWILKPKPQGDLLSGDIEVSDLQDSDFVLNLRQKGVDMRIGLDIATITAQETGQCHCPSLRRQRLCACGQTGPDGKASRSSWTHSGKMCRPTFTSI